MRRLLLSTASAGALTLVVAGSAFAAHCVNESKPDGAGVHVNVMINPITEEASFEGANANGKPRGGFADLWLDLDLSGDVTEGDVQLENDVFLVANHSGKANPAQGIPAVLPNVEAGRDPGGDGRGVGVNEH